MKTLLLNRIDVARSLDIDEVIAGVRRGYIDYRKNNVDQPQIVSIAMPKRRAECDLKCCYNSGNDTLSIKVAALYSDNGTINNLPHMMGTVLLFDTTDGNILSIMEGGLITGVRTGAAGAISCDLLARKDAHIVAVLGAGEQARMQVRALKRIRDITQIRVYSEFSAELSAYKCEIEDELGIGVAICNSVSDAMKHADIAVSTTPATKYIVSSDLVRPGMHIVAVGADDIGKNEWDPKVFSKADMIICDSISQCIERGETRNALEAGVIRPCDITGEIGEILTGEKTGRTSPEEITIFDTTGMGVQDNVTALKVYQKALQNGYGAEFKFI